MCPISKSTAHVVQTGHKHAHAHASSAVHARCSSTIPVLYQYDLGTVLVRFRQGRAARAEPCVCRFLYRVA